MAPYDGRSNGTAGNSSNGAHLSFSFHYFIHGESSVCASVDVRRHPPVRRLSLRHLGVAKSQASPVHVLLAPFGLAGTLTGVTYSRRDCGGEVGRLLKDWHGFYPLDNNSYFCLDAHGDPVAMPAAVEVSVSGVRMAFPTSYVFVSDMDQLDLGDQDVHGGEATKTTQTSRSIGEGNV